MSNLPEFQKTAVEVPPGNRISSRRNDTQRAGNPANHRSPDGTPTICYTPRILMVMQEIHAANEGYPWISYTWNGVPFMTC